MDWNNIAINIFSTTAIVSALGFVLKKSFEKLLDNRLKQAQEEHKAELAESQRRQAEIFNKRFDALKIAVSLVYRARNAARELSENASIIDDQRNPRHNRGRDRFKSIRAYHDAIEELLFEERSIMPAAAFKMLHDQKQSIHHFMSSQERASRIRRKGIKSKEEDAVFNRMAHKDIKEAFESLDKGYQEFVRVSQESMGLEYEKG